MKRSISACLAVFACSTSTAPRAAVETVDGASDATADAGLRCPPPSTASTPTRPLAVLFLTNETLYYHDDAHDVGNATMSQALRNRGHDVVVSNDSNDIATHFTPEGLAPFDAIFYFVTSGKVVDTPVAQAALVSFVHAGKGIVGAHSASATDGEWAFGRDMWGTQFYGHGAGSAALTEAGILVVDASTPMTSFLPNPWVRTDEWYYYTENPAKNPLVQPLLALNEADVAPYWPLYADAGFYGAEGHPLAWTMEYECGRVFYSALGHTGESWGEDNMVRMMVAGVEWAGAANAERNP